MVLSRQNLITEVEGHYLSLGIPVVQNSQPPWRRGDGHALPSSSALILPADTVTVTLLSLPYRASHVLHLLRPCILPRPFLEPRDLGVSVVRYFAEFQ